MVTQLEGFVSKLEASAIAGDVDKDRAAMVAVGARDLSKKARGKGGPVEIKEDRTPLGSLLRA